MGKVCFWWAASEAPIPGRSRPQTHDVLTRSTRLNSTAWPAHLAAAFWLARHALVAGEGCRNISSSRGDEKENEKKPRENAAIYIYILSFNGCLGADFVALKHAIFQNRSVPQLMDVVLTMPDGKITKVTSFESISGCFSTSGLSSLAWN